MLAHSSPVTAQPSVSEARSIRRGSDSLRTAVPIIPNFFFTASAHKSKLCEHFVTYALASTQLFEISRYKSALRSSGLCTSRWLFALGARVQHRCWSAGICKTLTSCDTIECRYSPTIRPRFAAFVPARRSHCSDRSARETGDPAAQAAGMAVHSLESMGDRAIEGSAHDRPTRP